MQIRVHSLIFISDQRNWPNARAFDELRSHLVTVGRIDQMRSAFGQTRCAIGQMRAHLAKRARNLLTLRIWSNAARLTNWSNALRIWPNA